MAAHHSSSNKPRHKPDRRRLEFVIHFKKEDGKVPPELYDSIARETAKVVAAGKREANKSTQLRRFYEELLMWQEKSNQQPDQFDSYLPFIRMLKAKAAYAEGRKLVDGAFVDMLEQTVDSIQSVEDLKVSKLFFEAFIGFYKLEKGD